MVENSGLHRIEMKWLWPSMAKLCMYAVYRSTHLRIRPSKHRTYTKNNPDNPVIPPFNYMCE